MKCEASKQRGALENKASQAKAHERKMGLELKAAEKERANKEHRNLRGRCEWEILKKPKSESKIQMIA